MTMKAHEIDYKILGDDMQAVEIELDPGETVTAEAGALNYMDEGGNVIGGIGRLFEVE